MRMVCRYDLRSGYQVVPGETPISASGSNLGSIIMYGFYIHQLTTLDQTT